MIDFAKLLNKEQYEAATAGDGPLLVLAAAGTGKTRTLVHRVAYLIEKGVPADRILLLTFTNRAAREMLERAQATVGPEVAGVWSGTFHSICAKILRLYGSLIGYGKSFQILDDADQKKLIGGITKDFIAAGMVAKDDAPTKENVLKIISQSRNENQSIETIAARWQLKAANINVELIEKIVAEYDKRKKELQAMDFDDLLSNALRLLKEFSQVRELFQEHFLYVLVDEYQDTNLIQAEFTDIIAAKHRNIMAVGDDFQCIYTWRGAQIDNILGFPQRWQGCRVVKLESNYRSLAGILDVANAVMKDASQNFDKVLRPKRKATFNYKPSLHHVYDGKAQANEILRIINSAVDIGYKYSNIAILYRSHFQSMDIQMLLARMQIPFRITSGIGMFEQLHIKDILAYLRLILNPGDEISFLRFIELLPGVGETSAQKYWNKLGKRFDCTNEEQRKALGDMLTAKARGSWSALCNALVYVATHLQNNKIDAIIDDYCDNFYFDCLFRKWEPNDAEERKEDIDELSSQIMDNPGGLREFLAEVALLTNLDAKRNQDGDERVTLSTVHQAKGMEWPVVAVPWCCDEMFPSKRAITEGRIEEERRLFYVAVTRAKDELHLFVPEVKVASEGFHVPTEPSTFISAIPEEMLREVGEKRANRIQDIGYGGFGRFNRDNGWANQSWRGKSQASGGWKRPGSSSSSGSKTTWRR